jgi:hypothetical protein
MTWAKIYFVIGGPPDFNPLVPAGMGTFCKLCTVARSLCWQGIVICWLRSSSALQPRSSSFVRPGKSPDVKALCLRSCTEGGRPKYMTFGLWTSNFHSNLFLLIMQWKSVHLMMVSTKDLGIHKALPDFFKCILRLCYKAKCDIKQPFFINKSLITGEYPLEIMG